jgi:DNA helicase-2/ATP-dependent DNA helicase PcrA
MEGKRRNYFVAITRTKEFLVLSQGKSYRGWQKEPSRFLVEMGPAGPTKKRVAGWDDRPD